MNRTLSILFVATFVLGLQTEAFGQAEAVKGKTVWDGVYSAAQAARGQAEYDANCSRCHGNTVGTATPSLAGRDFLDRWREDNLQNLFLFIKGSMPPARPRNAPRTPLPDNSYLDLVAYLLKGNSFPPGTAELKAETLEGVQIEEAGGPKPLPNSAFVQVVGCMTQNGTAWTLTGATEPTRSRMATGATMDELKAADTKPAGVLTFRLQSLDYLGPDMKPETHAGHRMQAKGILIRQPNAERIDVRSLAMVSEACKK